MAAWQENSAIESTLRKLLLGVWLAVLAPTIWARPAPWYWWASKSTERLVCAQTAPGPGWLREPVAFRDSTCTVRVKPF